MYKNDNQSLLADIGLVLPRVEKNHLLAEAPLSFSRHPGALGVYLVSLSRSGFLAQLWAQTSSVMQCVPFGGIDAEFSTNSFAFAFPNVREPMVSDFSTAIISFGKTKQMAAQGVKAEDILCLDREGNYSSDPKVFGEGGSILLCGGPRGGNKGYAMSLRCEDLTAMAGGSCGNPESKTRQTINMMVMDPEAFAGNWVDTHRQGNWSRSMP